jgi:hypothetical protein
VLIKEMRLRKAIKASVFTKGKVFQLICEMQHIIWNFQLIKAMLRVNAITVSVFSMAQVFQLI